MQSDLLQLFISLTVRFLSMDIVDYKVQGKRPNFMRKYYLKELQTGIPMPGLSIINEHDETKEYIAVYFPDHVIIDVDWKNGAKPTADQLRVYHYLRSCFYWLPSMTKTEFGCHIIVPKTSFANLPRGNPKLTSLCFGANIVEVLTDKPTIYKATLFNSYRMNTISMAPTQLDYLSFSPAASANPKATNRAVENRSIVNMKAVSTDNKPDPEFRALLNMISPDRAFDFHSWRDVGMIAKLLGDFDAWDDWSKKRPEKYKREENLQRWDSLPTSITSSIGSMHHWAKQDNHDAYMAWRWPYKQGKCAIESEGFAICKSNCKIIHNGLECSRSDAEVICAPIKFWQIGANGKGKLRCAWNTWIEDKDRKTYDEIQFAPYNPLEKDPTPDNVLNSAAPFKFTFDPTATEADLDDLKLIIKANCMDERKRRWVLEWYADIVQNPREKRSIGPAIKGHGQGTGKGSMFNLMLEVLGQSYGHSSNNMDDFFGQFNFGLIDKLLCNFEEMSGLQGLKNYDRMKTFITAPTNAINNKGKQQFYQTNLARVLCFSNQFNPLPADRRILFCQTNPRQIITHEWWHKFHTVKMKSPEYINKVGSALLTLNLTLDLNKKPVEDGDDGRCEARIRPIHILARRLEKDKVQCIYGNTDKSVLWITGSVFKEEYGRIAQARRKRMNVTQQGQTDFKEMKSWIEEYQGIITKRSREDPSTRKNARFYVVDIVELAQAMKANNLYPTDELMEEYYPTGQ